MLVFLLLVGMLYLSRINAMVCSIGLEPDPSAGNRYRWVIPVEDPCTCTEIRPGGMNTRTPGRNFKVIYFDISMSTAHELHKWLNCSSKWTGSKGEINPLAGEGAPSTYNTHSTTKEALLPLEFTACSPGNSYQTDPYDCAVFYFCSIGFWRKQTCGVLYFNAKSNTCDHTYNVPCPRV